MSTCIKAAIPAAVTHIDFSAVAHNPTLWKSIQAYNLDVVTETFAQRNPQYAAQAKELELETKRFMYLAAVCPGLNLAPTKPIDDYWHQFILFTDVYEDFCQKHTGYFVHHNPLAGPDHKSLFEQTQRLVKQVFGDAFKGLTWWMRPMPATSCKCTKGHNIRVATA